MSKKARRPRRRAEDAAQPGASPDGSAKAQRGLRGRINDRALASSSRLLETADRLDALDRRTQRRDPITALSSRLRRRADDLNQQADDVADDRKRRRKSDKP